jgi:hypothetical protein
MSKAVETAEREANYRAQAERYLAETNRILKRLANELSRHDRRRDEAPNILATAKSILFAPTTPGADAATTKQALRLLSLPK